LAELQASNKTSGQSGKEGQYVLAPEGLGIDHAATSVNAMHLKNMLGQIWLGLCEQPVGGG